MLDLDSIPYSFASKSLLPTWEMSIASFSSTRLMGREYCKNEKLRLVQILYDLQSYGRQCLRHLPMLARCLAQIVQKC